MKQRTNRDKFGTSALGRNPCLYIVTTKKGPKPNLNVRCHCMAPVGSKPWNNSMKYNPLGVVSTYAEAKALWDQHVASLTSGVSIDTL